MLDQESKICAKCNSSYKLSSISWKQVICRPCMQKYRRDRYAKSSVAEAMYRCIDCGTETKKTGVERLRRSCFNKRVGNSTTQKEYKRKWNTSEKNKEYRRKHVKTIKGRYAHYRSNAILIRKISFHLTFEQFKELDVKPCHYCQSPASRTGMGLDRVNNDLGYKIENVVPCCAPCNRYKYTDVTYDQMKIIGRHLANALKELEKSTPNKEDRA